MLNAGTAFGQAGRVIQSTFDSGDEGWIQVNQAGDFRYAYPLEEPSDCSEAPPPDAGGGVLSFCDPDAGAWMYEAPAKFLGDLSGLFGGQFEYKIRWVGDRADYPENLEANVVIASGDTALVFLDPVDPTPDVWVPVKLALDENAGWLWVDDTTPMEELPRATKAQIQQVLKSVTALRILGEFVTGSDRGFLDDVVFSGPPEPDRPQLSIRISSPGRVEITWPATAAGFTLETVESLDPQSSWSSVATGGQTRYEMGTTGLTQFFRLRSP